MEFTINILCKKERLKARSILQERGAKVHLALCSGERERRSNLKHVAGAPLHVKGAFVHL